MCAACFAEKHIIDGDFSSFAVQGSTIFFRSVMLRHLFMVRLQKDPVVILKFEICVFSL